MQEGILLAQMCVDLYWAEPTGNIANIVPVHQETSVNRPCALDLYLPLFANISRAFIPLGEAGNATTFPLDGSGSTKSAQGLAAVNSLGLLDLVQIAVEGLTPKSRYQIYLAESDHAPFGALVPLAVLNTNPDGAGTVQAIGPLKTLVTEDPSASVSARRYMIITELTDSTKVVLRQARTSARN